MVVVLVVMELSGEVSIRGTEHSNSAQNHRTDYLISVFVICEYGYLMSFVVLKIVLDMVLTCLLCISPTESN